MAALPGRGSLSRIVEHSIGSSRIGAAATLALAVGFGSAALAMSARGSPPPDLAISAFTAEVSTEGAIDARIVLVNNSNARIEGFAGWLLSVPGGDSWAFRSYRSSGQPLDLKAGESVTAKWSEIAPVPSGNYNVAAWAHVATPDGPIHSDGRPLAGYTAQIVGRSDLLRIEPPHRNLSITAVDPAESSPSELAVTVYLENEAETARTVQVRTELLSTAADDPLWWRSDPLVAVVESVEVAAGDQAEVYLSTPVVLMPGDYRVRVIVTEDDGQTLLDQILVADSAFRAPDFDASVHRGVLPAGPLMVTSIGAEPVWSEKDDYIVTVDVTNRSKEQVDGVLWWHLGDPGDPEPWMYASATSIRFSRTFLPGESRLVRLVADGPVPAGIGYELSVWVHSGLGSMGEHSDGVRFSETIDVTDVEDG